VKAFQFRELGVEFLKRKLGARSSAPIGSRLAGLQSHDPIGFVIPNREPISLERDCALGELLNLLINFLHLKLGFSRCQIRIRINLGLDYRESALELAAIFNDKAGLNFCA
jgi:hypothetical protein